MTAKKTPIKGINPAFAKAKSTRKKRALDIQELARTISDGNHTALSQELP